MFSAEHDDVCWESELYRLQGASLRASGGSADAEHCFQQAMERAKRLGTPILELRASVDLARLWKEQGRAPGARGLLMACLDRLTEGLETADVLAARELVSELSATPTDAGAPSGTH